MAKTLNISITGTVQVFDTELVIKTTNECNVTQNDNTITIEELSNNFSGGTNIIHVIKQNNIVANGIANIRMTKLSTTRGSSSVDGMGNISVNNI